MLVKFKDIIRVPACHLGQPIENILTDELNKQLANKVVLHVGLIICLHDIIDIGESYIYPGDGAIHTKCVFRMIVFRPQIGEVICGTLKSSSKEGLNISLGFFDSIIVPPQQLNEPSHFNEIDQSWTWNYEDEGQTHVLLLEIGEQIRFRVHSEDFVDVSPHGPNNLEIDKKEFPYKIIGTLSESGLGLVKWWNS